MAAWGCDDSAQLLGDPCYGPLWRIVIDKAYHSGRLIGQSRCEGVSVLSPWLLLCALGPCSVWL